MSAVAMRFRGEFRRRWRTWLALGLMVGVAGGAVTGLAAGALRTQSVYERFLARSAPSDFLVIDNSTFNPGARVDLGHAARLPGVAASDELKGLFAFGGRADGVEVPAFAVVPYSGVADELGRTVERSLVVAGRRADPNRVDEIEVSFEAARRLGVAPGSTLELDLVRTERLLPAAARLLTGLTERLAGTDRRVVDVAELGGAHRYRFTVVGVTSSPMDFPPVPGTLQPIVYPTPAFHRAVGHAVAGNDVLIVQLAPGATTAKYKAALEAANKGRGVTYAGGGRERFASAQRSVELQAQALWLLGGLVGLAGTLIMAQVLARQTVLESTDFAVLSALGMTRAQLRAHGARRAAVIATCAAATVVALSVSLSPLFPIGTAAGAEPTPGLRVEGFAIAVGALLTAALAFGISIVVDRLQLGRSTAEPRHWTLPAWTSRLPLTLHLGCRLALERGRGRTAVPIRSTLAALTLAMATAAMSVSFVASLDHLTRSPRLYGWTWDLQIGGSAVPDISEPLIAGLKANPAVDNLAIGTIAELDIGGRRVDGYALDQVQGAVSSGLLEGRAPLSADEITLGTVSMREAGLAVGDRVAVGRAGRTVDMHIVGRSVFPNLGDAGQLGRGAHPTFAGLERIAPGSLRNVALVDFVASSDIDREVATIRRALDIFPTFRDQRPDDLVNFGEGSAFPTIVVTTLAVVTAATLLHTLITSIRRRRADLAVLKALGLSRGQTSRTVAWQATVLAAMALSLGVPLGVIAGRLLWTVVAARLGVPAEPVTPVGSLVVLTVAVVALANLVAAGPAWSAGRTPPARILHAE